MISVGKLYAVPPPGTANALVTANAPVPPAGKVTMTDPFDSSISGFRDWLPYSPGRRKCETTCLRYAEAVTRFAAWARQQGRASFAEVTRADLRAYLNTLRGKRGGEAKETTKAVNWWAIRAMYRYLADEEELPDIAKSITMHRPPVPDMITHLDMSQVRALLAACRDPREQAVISVFLDTGVRISEAARLMVTDVCVDNLSARRIIVTGKGGKVRGIVMSAPTALALRRYLRWREKNKHAAAPELWLGARGPMTIGGLDQLIRAIGRRAGIEDIHPHRLRHTWAHHYRLSGGQTDNLTYLAGWEGPAMAIRYGRSAAAERAEIEARSLSLVDRARGHRA